MGKIMSKRIKLDLSVKEIEKAIREVEAYENDLNRKCKELCFRLCQEGIQIARAQIGESGFGRYIRLSSEITPRQAGCKAILYMEDIAKIKSEWQTLDGVKSAEVSPMLMLEFGSGQKAENPANIEGVGRGTFPDGKHGNEPGWYYMDLEGNWHYSTGISPKMPMYYAGKELRKRVLEIARQVFNE